MTKAELTKLLEKKSSRTKIANKVYEDRIALHSVMSVGNSARGIMEWERFVKGLVVDSKVASLKKWLRYPLTTNRLTKKMYTALYKVFDGINPFNTFDFGNDDEKQSAIEFLNTSKFWEFWKGRAWQEMKENVHSYVVVDLPKEGGDPYFYFVKDSDKQLCLRDDEGRITQFAFINNEQITVIDDTNYTVFEYENRQIGVLISESKHGLGVCPVRDFWTDETGGAKEHPLLSVLTDLDMLLYFSLATEYYQNYSRFDILSVMKTDCNYSNTVEYCNDGIMKDSESNDYIMIGGATKKCPACSVSNLGGAGTVIKIDPPNFENGNTTTNDPVKRIGADVPTLKYNDENLKNREDDIYQSITGDTGSIMNSTAINANQVFAIIQSKETALLAIQRNFENIMEWTASTMFALKFESFKSLNFSLGTEHYVSTESDLMVLYEAGVKNNFSTVALDSISDLYIKTKYKNNRAQQQRQLIFNNLDPFRHVSVAEVSKMYVSGHINYTDYMIKANLSTLISRFERENIDISQFGILLSFEDRINKIYKQLAEYVAEKKPKDERAETE